MLLPNDALTLTLLNPPAAGTATHFVFGRNGGSIGSADNDTWRLSAHRTGAVAGHAEVRFADGEYCLIDRSGRTYVNGASQPVGRGRRARLQQGDTIAIGTYQIRAEFGLVSTDAVSSPGAEPLQALSTPGQATSTDTGQLPWSLGDPEHSADAPSEDGVEGAARQPTYRYTHVPPAAGPDSGQHISAAPLLRGMNCDLALANSDDMAMFLEEAGQTLQAAISGLLALHQGEENRHQVLRTRLQPIEDNPLRFGGDYPLTVQTLFASHRSPVHLSAPAAVQESLASLHHHQQATREATRQGLEAILHALSPDALLQRFRGYRRGMQAQDDENTWAWDMYRHYYQELNSSRQQGFERLFQEVFDQAYDQHIRQLQRESLL